MRNSIRRFLLVLCSLYCCIPVFAQDNNTVDQTMRSNGKIYVVLAICLTILAGLFLFLVSIDRKIGKIEDKQ